MKSIIRRSFCSILCALLLLSCFSGCAQKSNPLSYNGFQSVTLDKKGDLSAVATFNTKTLEEHKGQTVRIFELLPGESPSAAAQKQPLDEKKIAAKVTFSLPRVREDGRDSLYSSFLLGFSDGTLLTDGATYVQNPQVLATSTLPVLTANSPKGCGILSPSRASALGATAVMEEISLAMLLEGDGVELGSGDGALSLSSALLQTLDKRIKTASDQGLSVSLTILMDTALTPTTATLLLPFLANRYGGEQGTVSALYLDDCGELAPRDAALYARIAQAALRSHVADGKIFLLTSRTNLTEAKAYFATVKSTLAEEGTFEWGVAVRLSPVEGQAWEALDKTALTVHTLDVLWQSVTADGSRKGAPTRLAVCGICGLEDSDLGAVNYAYLYRAAVKAGATSIFLNQSIPTGSTLEQIFRSIDQGLSTEQDALCAGIAGQAWGDLAATKATHTAVTGVASLDNGGYTYDPWFDFTDGQLHGFSAVNGLYAPQSQQSASYGKPVLYTWLASPAAGEETGVIRVLDNGEALTDAISLSVQVLVQLPQAEDCSLTLRLRGTSKSGAALTYESHIKVTSGHWQTVTFSVASFTSQADLSAPCSLSLVTDSAPGSTEEESNAFVFWLKGVSLRHPQKNTQKTVAAVLTVLGVAVG
ncbi:MAG: hypothetical protein IJX62_02400, partial [Clostridia bacterium]|nr:hypothetical protein [Clostridia bacterium]